MLLQHTTDRDLPELYYHSHSINPGFSLKKDAIRFVYLLFDNLCSRRFCNGWFSPTARKQYFVLYILSLLYTGEYTFIKPLSQWPFVSNSWKKICYCSFAVFILSVTGNQEETSVAVLIECEMKFNQHWQNWQKFPVGFNFCK